MLIDRMKPPECEELLARVGFGRLACARDNQPYIVPIYFGHQPNYLFGFATFGRKIEWMRSNSLVCVEADEVLGPDNWTSVIILGRYEELPDTAEYSQWRRQAQSLLRKAVFMVGSWIRCFSSSQPAERSRSNFLLYSHPGNDWSPCFARRKTS
jgi:uncharacterized protein